MQKTPLIISIFIGVIVCMIIAHNAAAQENIFPIEKDASCITSSCHEDMGKKKYVHLVGINRKYCYICHELAKEGEHRFIKLPPESNVLCAKCHSEHLKQPIDLTEFRKAPPMITFEGVGYFHDPFAEGKCTECHDPHESDFKDNLKAEYPGEFYAPYSARTYSLCFSASCHKGLEKAFTEPRTLTDTRFRNGNLNLHFRHVNKKKGRTCLVCHHYHNADNTDLIRETFLFREKLLPLQYKKTETGGSCTTTCHIPVKYDRYNPVKIIMKTTPRIGTDATPEELKLSHKRDMKELKAKLRKSKNK